jgi:hypothetical protein
LCDPDKAKTIIFTDEKKFQPSSDAKTEYVSRKIGSNAFDEKFIQFDHAHSSIAGVNVWGYIGPFGKGI